MAEEYPPDEDDPPEDGAEAEPDPVDEAAEPGL
ncbi:hypothetical protein FB473_003239 [Brooklawnia cerclae]|uniref:Uncharacterized protein n=1 Tax=Brooklawnia cerclae TaxID=349934 RepID=A0ABX0SJG5_9ACTN|nr:hypothetical protein [Brooklawnia cerclae]